MSLIKAVDVPKYRADRANSRSLGARLSRGSLKQPILVAKKAAPTPAVPSPGSPVVL